MYFIWGDILDETSTLIEKGLNSRSTPLQERSFEDAFSYMSSHFIDLLVIGHNHKDEEFSDNGVAIREYGKRSIVRHVQGIGSKKIKTDLGCSYSNSGYGKSILAVNKVFWRKKLNLTVI